MWKNAGIMSNNTEKLGPSTKPSREEDTCQRVSRPRPRRASRCHNKNPFVTALPGRKCFLVIWFSGETDTCRYLAQPAILRDPKVRELLREVCHEVEERA